jgi:uncharacterized protein YbjQ (UPF0145 family)
VVDAPGHHEAGRAAARAEADPRLSRLDRLRHARGWSFAGPVGGFGAASIAGFDPVGQVFGTTVAYPGPVAYDRCFVTTGPATPRTDQTSADPYNPVLARLYTARRLALERAVAECQALGGDGIIGARMSCANFFTDTMEFTIEGTAVRAHSSTRPAAPFTTHVRGQDLARLLSSGWMPFALVTGIAIASCHFDESMFQQTRRGVGAAGNREVSGYTRVVNDARRGARSALETAVRGQGGQGSVIQDMTLCFSERECPSFEERLDYVVEATILGSAIVPFERSEPAVRRAPLAIMRLDRDSGATAEPEPGPGVTAGPSLGDRAFAYWANRGEARPSGSSGAH